MGHWLVTMSMNPDRAEAATRAELPPQMGEQITSAYGLTDVSGVEAQHSYSASNYVIDAAEGRFFLKQRLFSNEERNQEIVAAERFFAARNLPVPIPIPTVDRMDGVETLNGVVTLYPFIRGRQMRRSELGTRVLEKMGAALGQLHRMGADDLPDVRQRPALNGSEALIGMERLLDAMPVNLSRDDLEILSLFDQKRRIIESGDFITTLSDAHLIHGDFQEKNLLFDANDDVVAMVDFDNSEIASRFIELARTLDKVCFNGSFESQNYQRAQALLTAYSETYPLNSTELSEGIRTYYLYKATNLWRERQIYFFGNELPKQFIPKDLSTLTFIAEHRQEHADALLTFLD